MGDGEVALERRDVGLVEHLGHEAEVLVDHHAIAVADRDAGRFLAPVLEREQAQRRERRCLLAGRVDADDTAHRASPPGPWGSDRQPSSPRARGRPCSQASRSTSSGSSRSSAMPAPRSSARAGRALAHEPDAEPVAAGLAQDPRAAPRPVAASSTSTSQSAGAIVTRTRLGLSPNRSRAGSAPTPSVRSAPTPPQRHISAMATARPPPLTSWAARSRPARLRRAAAAGGRHGPRGRAPVAGRRVPARPARRRWSHPCPARSPPAGPRSRPGPPAPARHGSRCRRGARPRPPGRWARWRPSSPIRCRG